MATFLKPKEVSMAAPKPQTGSVKKSSGSKTLQAMKFMQRRVESVRDPEGPEVASMEVEGSIASPCQLHSEDRIENNARSLPNTEVRWTLGLVMPELTSRLASEEVLVISQVEKNLAHHVLGRRSFNGFNSAVENAYEEASESPEAKRRKRAMEKDAVSDREMADFYKNRVGISVGGKGGGKGGKGKGQAKSISNGGRGSTGGGLKRKK